MIALRRTIVAESTEAQNLREFHVVTANGNRDEVGIRVKPADSSGSQGQLTGPARADAGARPWSQHRCTPENPTRHRTWEKRRARGPALRRNQVARPAWRTRVWTGGTCLRLEELLNPFAGRKRVPQRDVLELRRSRPVDLNADLLFANVGCVVCGGITKHNDAVCACDVGPIAKGDLAVCVASAQLRRAAEQVPDDDGAGARFGGCSQQRAFDGRTRPSVEKPGSDRMRLTCLDRHERRRGRGSLRPGLLRHPGRRVPHARE